MDRYVTWDFPLPRTHTGIMFGNATMGVLAWGEGNLLKLTLGRADLWDHRGGMPPWTDAQNLKAIRKCLEANDEKSLRKIFACATENVPGQPKRPSVVPVGRFDIDLGKGAKLVSAKLDLKTAHASIVYTSKGVERKISIVMSMDSDLCLLELPEKVKVESVPSWNYLGGYLKSISFKKPEMLASGWFQALPADPGVCALFKQDGARLWIATARNKDAAVKLVESADAAKFLKGVKSWWSAFWKDVPDATLPNPTLSQLYAYGLYKFACLTNPAGTPATLQGPWIEEYEMPPWSSDYHFNINVQMCYWPAYKANRVKHLLPIFELVWSWREKLRDNAKAFVGIDDGFMLPHAVDDHCVCMGSFWTGTIDHACAAWMAQMMFAYYRQTLDVKFLREIAFPFMRGVMRVYEEMMERDGASYCLPVSVSPEYRGDAMNAWGRNASFQLAAAHRLLIDLDDAAKILGETLPKSFAAISKGLPQVALVEGRIALWEGTDLEESHRHHSHLAAICPFETIDPHSTEWRKTVADSIGHWVRMGMGLWTGWCVPWASMIHSRLGNGAMAEMLLEICERVFSNKGHGTLHNCEFFGFSIMGSPAFGVPDERREIMQMDAAMGMLTAVQDMLLVTTRGVVRVFPGVPPRWRECSFDKMPCDGGFLISAVRSGFATRSVEVKSLNGGVLRLANPWSKAKLSGKGKMKIAGDVIELKLGKGESACIEPAVPLD